METKAEAEKNCKRLSALSGIPFVDLRKGFMDQGSLDLDWICHPSNLKLNYSEVIDTIHTLEKFNNPLGN